MKYSLTRPPSIHHVIVRTLILDSSWPWHVLILPVLLHYILGLTPYGSFRLDPLWFVHYILGLTPYGSLMIISKHSIQHYRASTLVF
jgi:hypothetical protein